MCFFQQTERNRATTREVGGQSESDKELCRQENYAAREHLEMMSTQSKRSTRMLGIAK